MKTEWKEFYKVLKVDRNGSPLNEVITNIESYEEALGEGEERFDHFTIQKYYKKVGIETVYEYRVLFKNVPHDEVYLTSSGGYYKDQAEFDETKAGSHIKFIELVQTTKRERK